MTLLIRFRKQIKTSWTSTSVESYILSAVTFIGLLFPFCDDLCWHILSLKWRLLRSLSFHSVMSFVDPFLFVQWRPLLAHSFILEMTFLDPFFPFSDDLYWPVFPFSDVLHWPVLSYQWWTSLTQAFLSVTTFIDPFFLSVMTFINPFFPFSDDLHRCDRLLRWFKHSAAGSGELLHLRSCGHLRHICPPGFWCLVQVSGV